MNAADPPPPPSPEAGKAPAPPSGRPGKAPPRARTLLATWSAQMLLVLVFGLPVALVGTLVTVLHSSAGTAWLLGGLPGLKVDRPQGALLGTDFAADRVVLSWPGQGALAIDALAWSGARWRWWLSAELWAGVEMGKLSARRVQWRTAPDAGRLQAPTDVRLPLRWQVERLEIETLDIDGFSVQALSAGLELGGEDGHEHRLSGLRLRSAMAALSGQARLSARPTPTVSVRLDATSLADPGWQAQAQAEGPLDAIRLTARLQGLPTASTSAGSSTPAMSSSAAAGSRAPSLDGELTLRPFEPWPVGALALRMESLDLSTLAKGWPRTALSGHAEIRTAGLDRPATAEIDIDNARPEAWDRGGLPLRRAAMGLSAVPERTDAVDFSRAEIELAAGDVQAGRLQGQGRWSADGLDLDLRLNGLRPQRLHSAAASLSLSGPLRARISGLPGPAMLRPHDNQAQPSTPWAWHTLVLDLQTDLQGDGPTLRDRLRVALDAQLADGRLEWRRFEATDGSARAQAKGVAERNAQGAWRTRTEGRLENFDPARWWPGSAEGPWRQGRHALNASWQLDLASPRGARSMPMVQGVQMLQGVGTVRLAESTLAGVGLSGQVTFAQGPPGSSASTVSVDSDLLVGSNRIQIRGQGDPSGTGESDRWELRLDGRALRELTPLAQLQPALQAWSPRSGRLRAQLEAQGRWPRLITQGELDVSRLEAGTLAVDRGEMRWKANSVDRQSGELTLDLKGMQWGRTRLDVLEARLDGTFAQHRAQLNWKAPLSLPTVAAHLLGLDESRQSQGEVSIEGGWSAQADGAGQWNGQVRRLRAAHAATSTASPQAPWLDARDVRTRVEFAPGGRLSEFQIGAGRASLGPVLRLRWDEIAYRLQGERRDFALDFEVEPTEVAPVLQRAHTGLTWTGDLRLGMRGRMRAAEELQAEVTLRRLGGDLAVGEGDDRQSLGLTQAGLTLNVQAGVWRVAPLLAGSALGTISGALELRTQAEARWPGGDAALSGAVQAEVNDLSIWSAWVPPGWGLSGRLATTAGVSGRLDAPEFTGELRASEIGVRNLLEGVSFRDGRARIALRGDRAQIEQLELRGGEGMLRVSGEADIGLQPQARLRLDARQLTLLGRLDRQLTVTGDGTLDLRRDRVDLRGRLAVDRGLIDLGAKEVPTLDRDVVVPGPDSAPREALAGAPPSRAATPALAAPSPWMRRSSAALDLELGRQLRVRGRGLDTPLQGQLKVSVQEGRLAVNGTIDARGGTYTAYGQKLEIDRGRVQFTGTPDNPRLDLLALRPKTDMRVGVAIAGTAQNPRVRLYSDPEMGERDKLSWLVLGRGAEGLGRTDTTVLQRAALALLSGEQEAPTDAFLRSLGIDELTFGQTDGDVRETVVGLGKQLGRNWYVGYERGVNATVGTWQLVYRLAQQFTLRARSGEDASLDLVWSWRFDRARDWSPAMLAPSNNATGTGATVPARP